MHSAATDGVEGSPGAGRIAFDASWRIFPGESEPSSVVRSQHLNARSSAHILESLLIDRFASDAARSVAPTASTAPPMRSTSSSGCCMTVATDGLLPCPSRSIATERKRDALLGFWLRLKQVDEFLGTQIVRLGHGRVRSLQHDGCALVGELHQVGIHGDLAQQRYPETLREGLASATAEQLVARPVIAGEVTHVLDDASRLESGLLGHESGALGNLLRHGLGGRDRDHCRPRNELSDRHGDVTGTRWEVQQ